MSRILNMKYIPEIKSELQWFDNLKALICIFASNSCHWRSILNWKLVFHQYYCVLTEKKNISNRFSRFVIGAVAGIFLVK